MSSFDQQKFEQLQGKALTMSAAPWPRSWPISAISRRVSRARATGPLQSRGARARSRRRCALPARMAVRQRRRRRRHYDPARHTFSLSPEQAALFLPARGRCHLHAGLLPVCRRQHENPRHGAPSVPFGPRPPVGRAPRLLFLRHRPLLPGGGDANLVEQWIPALDGVAAKPRGRRQGGPHRPRPRLVPTILLGPSFPKSKIHGFDFHEPSIEKAR